MIFEVRIISSPSSTPNFAPLVNADRYTPGTDASKTGGMSTVAYSPPPGIRYVRYESTKEAEYVPKIRQLISKDLSEPYSIYVYRYFLYQWGDLCFMVCPTADL